MTLTPGRKFALACLATEDLTAGQISFKAHAEGVSQTAQKSVEWADKYVAWLRKNDLAETTGERRGGARVHRITDTGRAALAQAD